MRSVVAPRWFHLVDVEVLVDVVRARNVVGLWRFDACEGIDEFVERRIVGVVMGTIAADDISLRISAEAEGSGALDAAVTFARDLSARVGV